MTRRLFEHLRRRWILLTIGLVVVAWGALAAQAFIHAHTELDHGMRAVDRVRGQMTPGDLAAGRPIPGLRAASADFGRAQASLDGVPLLGVRLLPVLGRQVHTLSAVAGGAAKVSGVAAGSISDARSVLSAPSGTLANEAGTVASLAGIANRTMAAIRSVPLGPSQGLFSSVAHARRQFANDLSSLRNGLQRGITGAAALEDLFQGTHQYLLFAANNAEMRAGSGMFLSAGVLTTGSTGISLSPMETVTTITVPAGVALTGDLAARWAWLDPNQEWRNLMTSPNFDASAQLASQMWVASGHQPVEGVIAIDAVALQAVLQATGPVTVAGRSISAAGVVDELLNIQYFRYNDDQTGERREELATIADAAFTRLLTGGWTRPVLADGLQQAAQGRHILAWSANGADEAGWKALGIDGVLHPNSLLLSVLNRGGNKLDDFLKVSSAVSFQRSGRDTEVTLRLTLDNQVPPGQPFDVIGPDIHSGVGAGVYLGIVTVNMPAAATDGHFDGVDHLAVAGHDGATEVMGFQLQVAPGMNEVVVAHFLLPGAQGTLDVEPSARVPATKWTDGTTVWHDVAARAITYRVGAP
ncbi:MAG: DUF4012 domain-containing protein [Acidimicrobiales bacterium]